MTGWWFPIPKDKDGEATEASFASRGSRSLCSPWPVPRPSQRHARLEGHAAPSADAHRRHGRHLRSRVRHASPRAQDTRGLRQDRQPTRQVRLRFRRPHGERRALRRLHDRGAVEPRSSRGQPDRRPHQGAAAAEVVRSASFAYASSLPSAAARSALASSWGTMSSQTSGIDTGAPATGRTLYGATSS
jgi:hypothetical protein